MTTAVLVVLLQRLTDQGHVCCPACTAGTLTRAEDVLPPAPVPSPPPPPAVADSAPPASRDKAEAGASASEVASPPSPPAVTDSAPPASHDKAEAGASASDACLSASVQRLSMPGDPVQAQRVFTYTSQGSGTSTDCQSSYTFPELNELFEPFCRDWVQLGRERGWWSVLTNDEFDSANEELPESTRVEFYASGVGSIDHIHSIFAKAGVAVPGPQATVLDFGCGVARLTAALSRKYEQVICVDQSHVHLELAQAEYDRMRRGDCDSARSLAHLPQSNTATFLLTGPNMLDRMGGTTVDMVITLISLQHTVPPLMVAYLEQFCDVLAPGGIAYIHVPTFQPDYHVSKLGEPSVCDFKQFFSKPGATGRMQVHCLGDAQIQAHMDRRGCEMLYSEICSGTGVGKETCYVFRKRVPAASDQN